jgi:acyl transferase domain-containing protein
MTHSINDFQPPIAIVGVSALMPGSDGVDALWRNVLAGADLVTDIPPDRWRVEDYYDPDPRAPDRTYSRRGAFLPPIRFDPLAFGLPPSNLEATDSAQLLALVAASRLLADVADGRPEPLDGERVAVILGSGPLKLMGDLEGRMGRPLVLDALRARGMPEDEAQATCDAVVEQIVPFHEASFPGSLSNVVAGRVANRFDLHGTSCTVDAACASSMAALSMAVDELTLGRADLVITGAADTHTDPLMFVCFSKTPALSPTGDCRPFDEDADGTVLGEGVAMFALKRLADAERDADRVYAVIRGIGSSSDGRATSIYGPLAAGQERALRRAYGAAGYGPSTVALVEAHGTGTVAGDGAELAALGAVFGEDGANGHPWCALGSIKSQVGHLKSAAGAAGLLKAVLALHHRVLPPTIKVRRPAGTLASADGPFYVSTTARPWTHQASHPRRASVSSFGFGGTNFHVALEEYVESEVGGARRARRRIARPTELVTLSDESPGALAIRCGELAAQLSAAGENPLDAFAQRGQEAFRPEDDARVTLIAASATELAGLLATARDLIAQRGFEPFSTPDGIRYATGSEPPARIGFLFPGQGSQYPGMGADLAVHFASAQAIWDGAGATLADVVFPRPALDDAQLSAQRELLAATEHAQPAIATHSLALLGLLDACGVRPDCAAGHSFGELVALHAARAFDADVLLAVARARGALMRDAATSEGSMLAVDADRDAVAHAIAGCASSDLWVANHNAPRQVVVAGATAAVGELERSLGEAGVACSPLPVATAFHSPIVAGAAEPFHEHLRRQRVRGPLLDVYRNAGPGTYPVEPDEVRRTVAEQILAPVRFVDMIESMYADGIRTFVEVGPGSVLTGLVGSILAGRPFRAVPTDRRGRHGVTSFQHALAELATAGVPLTFEALWEGRAAPAEECASAVSVEISGGNHGRRYPPAARAQSAPHAAPPRPQGKPAAQQGATEPAARPAPAPHAAAPPAEMRAAVHQDASGPILDALLEIQRETARAHASYLATVELSVAALLGARAAPPPAATPAGSPGPVTVQAPPLPVAERQPPRAPAPAPAAPGDAALRAPAARPGADLHALVLRVVSEQTGYPVEMLDAQLELEADLGIDSLGRTQILEALLTSLPQLAAAQAGIDAELVAMRTLADLAHKLGELQVQASREPHAGAGVEPRPEPERPLTRMVTTTTAAPRPGRPLAGLGLGELTIVDDDTGVAPRLAACLARHGVAANVADTVAPDAAGVVFLGGLADIRDPEDGVDIQRRAIGVASTVAARLTERGGVFVTVQDTGGAFGASRDEPIRVWLGGLAALARTAAQEWPQASVRAIDCARGGQDPAAVAEAIAAELLEGGDELDVALTPGGARSVLGTAPAPAARGASPGLGPESVVVVSGGATGVTGAAVLALARRHRCRFLLLGRSTLDDEPADLANAASEADIMRVLAGVPSATAATPAAVRDAARRILRARDVRATLAELEQIGSAARYVALDVRDSAAVAAAVTGAREAWGPITGVVHGAGLPALRRIVNASEPQFEDVFGTKVGGLRSLLAATADDPLRVLCGFSSIAGRYGFFGQSDYTMANETLDHVLAAEQAVRPGCRVLSIQWGPWNGGMVRGGVDAHLVQSGVPLIALDSGAEAFVAELESAAADPRIMITGGPDVARLAQAGFAS